MTFTSFRFFVFFAVLLILFYSFPRKYRWCVLLAASLLFCWSFNRLLTAHIALVSAAVWGAGRGMGRSFADEKEVIAALESPDREAKKAARIPFRRHRRRLLLIAMGLLFGSLLVFKFYNPFAELLEGRGMAIARIAVPVGISFYTLQIASYLFDVYNRNQEAEPNFARFLLFASWFPCLIQGPICRYAQIAGSLRCEGPFQPEKFSVGFARVIGGFIKKLVIADRLAALTNTLFAGYTEYAGASVALAGIGYAVQLYCDFSGGIDIALGLSRMLGVSLPENFRRPYFSRSVSEYWRRWHATLGAWFKDYIFYPLTLSGPMTKLGKALREKNPQAAKRVPALLSMGGLWLCSAIWHGEGSQFLLWGLFHWCMVSVDTLSEAKIDRCGAGMRRPAARRAFAAGRIAMTFLCVSFGELIFRAEGLHAALYMIGALFRGWSEPVPWLTLGLDPADLIVAGAGVLALFLFEFAQERGKGENCCERIARLPLAVRWSLLLGGIALVAVFGVYGTGYDPAPFLYFQF